ncbi:MAG: hypothetical protein RIK87_07665 [Fuerstiella sp.]
MSLKSYLDRLRRRILKRMGQAAPRPRGRLRVVRLEDRRLLDATASLVGGALLLESFDALDQLTISDSAFSPGGIDFGLASGVWNAPTDPGLVLSAPGILTLSPNNMTDLTVDAAADPLASVNATDDLQLSTLQITGGGDVLLTDANNDFDSVSIDADSLSLVDVDAVELTSLSITLDASVTATDITDGTDAVISVGGNASFSGTSVTLGDDVGDTVDFGTLSFTASGDIDIVEASSTVLDGTNSAGSLTLSSNGSLTDDSASLSVTGHTDLSAAEIILGDQSGDDVDLGTLNFNCTGDVTIHEADDIDLSADSTGTSVLLTAKGSIDISANVTASGSLSIAADSDGNAIGSLLCDTGTTLTGTSVTLSGVDVTTSAVDGGTGFVDIDATNIAELNGTTRSDGAVAIDAATSIEMSGAISGSTTGLGAASVSIGSSTVPGLLTILDNMTARDGIALSSSGNISIGAGAVIDSDGNGDSTGDLTVAVTGTLTQGAGSKISGSGGLIVPGAGTLSLSQANDFTGQTTISSGAVSVTASGSTDSNTVINGGRLELAGEVDGNIVMNAGTLNGSGGEITGTLTVNSGGTVAPGNSPGQLTVGNLDLKAGSTLQIDMNGFTTPGTDFDQIVVASGASIVSLVNATLDVSGAPSGPEGSAATIIDNQSGTPVTTTFNGLADDEVFTADGHVYRISYNGTDGTGNDTVLVYGGIADTLLAIDGSGNLVVSDIDGNNSNDTLTVSFDGTHYVVTDPDRALTTEIAGADRVDFHTIRVSAAAVTGNILINTGGGDDRLTIDFTTAVLPSNVLFDGGSGGVDSLIATGGTFQTAVHTFTSTGPGLSGSLAYDVTGDGSTPETTISYVNLEPVDMTGSTIADLVFNLPATDNNVILEDDGTGGNSVSQIRSGNGTFETTTFSNPSGSLTINGNAGAFDDNVVVSSVPDFSAALRIKSNGGTGNDTVVFAGSSSIDSVNIDITGAISDNGAANLTVANNAQFVGSGVTLDDTYRFGTLTFASGVVTIVEADNISLSGTNTATTLNLTSATGNISDSGTVNVTGMAQFNAAAGLIDLNQLNINGSIGVTADTSATLVNASTVDLKASTVGTDLVVTANAGNITDSDTVNVGGMAQFNAAAGLIDLNQLNVTGSIGVTALTTATLVNTSTVDLKASTVGTDLVVTANSGNITDSDTVNVGGMAQFNAAAGLIDLNQLNVTGSIGVTANTSATLVNTSTVDLKASTVGTNLVVTANSGNITDSDTVNVTGMAQFNAAAGLIDLNQLNVTGSIGVTALTTATLVNASTVDLKASTVGTDLDVTATTGNITDSGNLLINGTSTLNAPGDILLDSADNNFIGAVTISNGAAAKLVDKTDLVLGPVNITDNLMLVVAGNVTQNAAITARGLALMVQGTTVLNDANNNVVQFAADNGGDTSYQDADGIVVGSVGVGTMLITGAEIASGGIELCILSGDIQIAQLIRAATDVRLQADNGRVFESGPGHIQSSGLGVRAQGDVTLQAAANDVARFSAVSVGGNVTFRESTGFTVGTVADGICFTTVSGITVNNTHVMLQSGGAIAVRQAVDAGTGGIRMTAGGSVTQDAAGIITATELGIIQQGNSGDIDLGSASNDVDVFAAANTATGGTIRFFDDDTLRVADVSALTIDAMNFAGTSGIDAEAGNINITSVNTLTVERNIDAASAAPAPTGPYPDESITLISRNGDFIVSGGTAVSPIIITTDENPAAGVFFDSTGDRITILAGVDGGTGTVSLGDPATIEIRTDGGVARRIAPRPTAFALPGTVNGAAFVTLADAAGMRGNLTFQDGGFLGMLDLVFGVAGEENLEVVVDWGAVSQTSLTSSGPAGNADPAAGVPGALQFSLTDADKAIFYIDQGGERYLIPHIYQVGDLITTAGDRNGREVNPGIFGVRFSVAQHASISIWGNTPTNPTTGAGNTVSDFSGTADPITDATGRVISPAAATLALLSSTDTNNLRDFSQQAAMLPFANGVVTSTGRPVGLAEWEFIAGPSPGIVLTESQERPTIEVIPVEARFEETVFSDITSDISFGAGAATDATIGTEVYLQIRRQFELDQPAEVVVARIADNTFISNREQFEEFVRDNPELADGAGYEVWLVTETDGQKVERPIVKFEITGGRPGPATDELPETFEPYHLKELDFEQPEPVPEPPPDPKQDMTGAELDNLQDSMSSGIGLVTGTFAFSKAARWKQKLQQRQQSLTRTGRTVRKMSRQATETTSDD